MQRFIFQIFIFCFLTAIAFVYLLSFADGKTDPFYLRFISPQQNNIIIGTSRAAQGIQPKILKEVCDIDFYNYAFTVGTSPFGKTYYHAIQKKINPKTKDGTFIIAIDPWSICASTSPPEDSSLYAERDLHLGNTPFTNINPNPFYLINNINGKYYTIFTEESPYMELHNDGWLEVTVGMDSLEVKKRTEGKIKKYRDVNFKIFKYSPNRFYYLKKTINYLSNHGNVYLIRLPIHSEMYEMEKELVPNFDSLVNSIVPMTKGYYDMTSKNDIYTYIDGNHLYKISGKQVTLEIGKWINNKR